MRRPDRLALFLALVLALVLSSSALVGAEDDFDGDGVPDALDNCIEVPNGPLAGACSEQQDDDEDGYGNACDFDFNNNAATDLSDHTASLNAVGTADDPQLDVNCNGAADLGDFTIVTNNLGSLPGPSGLACSGANAKGTCPPQW